MPSIDNRVVSIKFDNAQFEQKVGTTLSSLDKLKEGLQFDKAAQGLEDLTQAGKNFSMEGMGSSIDGISAKFIAMSTVAITALSNITNKVIDTGLQFAKSLAIDPLTQGFSEYQTNLNAIQTTLANTKSKGTTLDQVEAGLQRLNEYSDQTIYNFGQMAEAVGKFTTAGVGLDTSIQSIKGFSNIAALTGTNAEKTALAMTQLSQAVASGTLRLEDWRSIEQSGIGGEQFKESLKETARAHGVAVDSMIKKNGSFQLSLQEGWATAEIMTETLNKFTGDLTDAQLASMGYNAQQIKGIQELAATAKQSATIVKTFPQLVDVTKEAIGSGWSETFTKIIGNLDEASKLFTSINDVFSKIIGRFSDARNARLDVFRQFEGREAMIQALREVMTNLGLVLYTVQQAFRQVFPRKTGEDLANFVKSFRDFLHSLIPSQETLLKLQRIFVGVFSVLHIGWTIVKVIVKSFWSLLDVFRGLSGGPAGGFLEIIAKMGDGLKKLSDIIGNGEFITDWVAGLVGRLKEFVSGIDLGPELDFVKGKFEDFKKFIESMNLGERFQKIIDAFNEFKEKIFSGEGIDFSRVIDAIKEAVEKLKEALSGIFGKAKGAGSAVAGSDALAGASSRLSAVWEKLVEIGRGVYRVLAEVGRVVMNVAGVLGGAFSGIFEKIGQDLQHGDFSTLGNVFKTGVLAYLVLQIRNFIKKPFDKLMGIMDQLKKTLEVFQQAIKADMLLKIAKAIGILALSLIALSFVDPFQLLMATIAIKKVTDMLVAVIDNLDKIAAGEGDLKKLGVLAGVFLVLSISIGVLARAMGNMAELDVGQMAVATGAIILFLREFKGMINDLPSEKDLIKGAIGIYIISRSVNSLVDPVVALGSIDFVTLGKGLIAVGLIIRGLTEAFEKMPKDADKKSVSVLGLAVALKILANVVHEFGTMDWGVMEKGMGAAAALIAGIVLAFRKMPESAKGDAATLVAMAAAVLILAGAVIIFGKMDPMEAGKGILFVALSLAALAGAAKLMSGPDALPAAGAIVAISVGILILAVAIEKFNAVGIGGLALGFVAMTIALIGLAVGIAIIATISDIFSESIPVMLAMGVAMLVFGEAMLLFGVGILAAAAGVYLFVKAIQEWNDIQEEVTNNVLYFLMQLGTAAGQAVVNFFQVVLDNMPGFIAQFGDSIKGFIQVIWDNLPGVHAVLDEMIGIILQIVHDRGPQLIEAGFEILMALLRGLDENIYEIATRVGDIIIKFQNAMNEKMPEIITSGTNLIMSFLEGINQNAGKVTDKVFDIIGTILDTIKNRIQEITDKGGDIIVALIDGISKKGEDIRKAGLNALLTFLIGLASDSIQLAIAFGNIIVAWMNAMATAIDQQAEPIGRAAGKLGRAIFEGLRKGIGAAMLEFSRSDGMNPAARFLLEQLAHALGVESPSKKTYPLGVYFMQGLVNGIMDSAKEASTQVKTLGTNLVGQMESTMNDAALAMSGMDEFNPTITPVLDLTGIKKGADEMSSLMASPTLDTSLSTDQAEIIAKDTKPDETPKDKETPPTEPKQVVFQQTINAPNQLSTDDIYRQTKSQIALAKEELKV